MNNKHTIFMKPWLIKIKYMGKLPRSKNMECELPRRKSLECKSPRGNPLECKLPRGKTWNVNYREGKPWKVFNFLISLAVVNYR
jgi:hypothetical protein